MIPSMKRWIEEHKLLFGALVLVLTGALLYGYFALGRPALLKTRYRLAYEQEIRAAAEEFSLDPYLVCGVIFTESSFHPEAKSGVGALGLMQLMPATGLEEAELLGLAGVTEEQLLDPALNIRLGCAYLRKLLDEFGNPGVALAAYNAGPGRARQWLEQYGTKADGTLLYIPYPETDKYVGRVNMARGVYSRLYAKVFTEDEA